MAAKQDGKSQNAVADSPASGETAGQSKFVGSETCKGRHEDQFKNFEAGPHSRTQLSKIRGEAAHGCESCHGPGAAHVEGGGDKTKIFTFIGAKPEAITKRCLACHESNPEQREFMRSTHNENGVSCTSCHSVHHSTQLSTDPFRLWSTSLPRWLHVPSFSANYWSEVANCCCLRDGG